MDGSVVDWVDGVGNPDFLAICYLPHSHDGDCHWRVPTSISLAHPDFDRLAAMSALADEHGMAGAAAVDAAWQTAGLVAAAV